MKSLNLILLILVFNVNTLKSQCLQRDIILIGDFSHSTIGYENFIKDAFNSFIDQFYLSENTIQIGVVIFSQDAFLISPLSFEKEKLKKLVSVMDQKTYVGKTNIFDALNVSYNELNNNGRENIKKNIILISDGDANGPFVTDIPYLITEINNNPLFTICSILVDSKSKNEIFMKNISKNNNENCYYSTKYDFLVEVLLRLDICM